jgi:hypothetical protein
LRVPLRATAALPVIIALVASALVSGCSGSKRGSTPSSPTFPTALAANADVKAQLQQAFDYLWSARLQSAPSVPTVVAATGRQTCTIRGRQITVGDRAGTAAPAMQACIGPTGNNAAPSAAVILFSPQAVRRLATASGGQLAWIDAIVSTYRDLVELPLTNVSPPRQACDKGRAVDALLGGNYVTSAQADALAVRDNPSLTRAYYDGLGGSDCDTL